MVAYNSSNNKLFTKIFIYSELVFEAEQNNYKLWELGEKNFSRKFELPVYKVGYSEWAIGHGFLGVGSKNFES